MRNIVEFPITYAEVAHALSAASRVLEPVACGDVDGLALQLVLKYIEENRKNFEIFLDPSTPPVETAKEEYDACEGDKEPSPIERLRFFCSCAMRGQDWLDVEPFFDALTTPGTFTFHVGNEQGGFDRHVVVITPELQAKVDALLEATR